MLEKDFGGVKVDVCEHGCKGIWFDWGEIRRLDESDEGFGNVLKAALNHPRENDENRSRINCPKCNKPMHIHKYQSSKEANVDECYLCGGFFLDSGELKAISNSFMSEPERKSYNEKLLADIPEYEQLMDDVGYKKARTAAIGKYTKFLSLSYLMNKVQN